MFILSSYSVVLGHNQCGGAVLQNTWSGKKYFINMWRIANSAPSNTCEM